VSTNSEEVYLNSVFDSCQETFLRSWWRYVLHGPSSSENACYLFTVYFYIVVFSVDSITA